MHRLDQKHSLVWLCIYIYIHICTSATLIVMCMRVYMCAGIYAYIYVCTCVDVLGSYTQLFFVRMDAGQVSLCTIWMQIRIKTHWCWRPHERSWANCRASSIDRMITFFYSRYFACAHRADSSWTNCFFRLSILQVQRLTQVEAQNRKLARKVAELKKLQVFRVQFFFWKALFSFFFIDLSKSIICIALTTP